MLLVCYLSFTISYLKLPSSRTIFALPCMLVIERVYCNWFSEYEGSEPYSRGSGGPLSWSLSRTLSLSSRYFELWVGFKDAVPSPTVQISRSAPPPLLVLNRKLWAVLRSLAFPTDDTYFKLRASLTHEDEELVFCKQKMRLPESDKRKSTGM